MSSDPSIKGMRKRKAAHVTTPALPSYKNPNESPAAATKRLRTAAKLARPEPTQSSICYLFHSFLRT